MNTLTQENLKSILSYYPDYGRFVFKSKRKHILRLDKDGYSRIKIFSFDYCAHRLAFLYMTGKFPDNQIDHIDHNKLNNKWENLREVSHIENGRNASLSIANRSGTTGVVWDKERLKWIAQIFVEGKSIKIGRFNTHYAASYARHFANIKYGFHKNHGLRVGGL